MPNSTTDVSLEHLWELIRDTRFGMFTTVAADGELRSHPMTTQNKELEPDHSLWFFMSRTREPATELSRQPQVSVIYAHPGKDKYAHVNGSARIVEDPAKKQQLWTPMAAGWFPQGVNDPDLALVQVRMTHAQYWDIRTSKLGQLIRMASAAVTRKPPTDLGEHGELQIN